MIGVDIVYITRIREKIEKNSNFLQFFSSTEINHIQTKKEPIPTMAGIFAAKEAVVKAASNSLTTRQVEITFDPNGRPSAQALDEKFSVSISHDGEYAVAIAQKISHA